MFCTIRAATPRSVVILAPRRAGALRPFAAALGAGLAGGLRAGAAAGGLPGSPPARSAWPAATVVGGRGVGAGLGGGGRARWPRSPRPGVAVELGGHRRLVVGEEVVPGRVDAGRVGEVPLVHVLDDPLVGAEAREWVVLRSLLGRHGRVRLFHARLSAARDDDRLTQATPWKIRPSRRAVVDASWPTSAVRATSRCRARVMIKVPTTPVTNGVPDQHGRAHPARWIAGQLGAGDHQAATRAAGRAPELADPVRRRLGEQVEDQTGADRADHVERRSAVTVAPIWLRISTPMPTPKTAQSTNASPLSTIARQIGRLAELGRRRPRLFRTSGADEQVEQRW